MVQAVQDARKAVVTDTSRSVAVICGATGEAVAQVELRGLEQFAAFTGELVSLGYAPHRDTASGEQRTVRFVPDAELRILARVR